MTEPLYKEPEFDIPAHERQIGGDHYTQLGIQPADYAIANGFNYYECLVLRYLSRHRKKNGKQDLKKAIHCLELLIENEYGTMQEVQDMVYVDGPKTDTKVWVGMSSLQSPESKTQDRKDGA